LLRTLAALTAVLALAACATTGTPGSVSLPATSGSHAASGSRVQAPVYGVMVDILSDPTTYTISVVSWNAQVAATIKAGRRSSGPNPNGQPLELPYVSTTNTALYYLDGDQTVRELTLDGMHAVAEPVTKLQIGAGAEGVFAVSPDDRQIAVSVIDYSRSPVHVLLYTDTLAGGHPHVIYESDTNYVWPVAWHNGLLVLAHGAGPYLDNVAKSSPGQDNPYWAISYHVVDPVTAVRKIKLGEACTVSGPLSPAGTACIQGGTTDWTGANTDWAGDNWGTISSAASLSPDGLLVAAAPPDDRTRLTFYRRDGSIWYYVAGPGPRDWAGWLDATHLIVGSAYDLSFQTRVVTLTSITPALQYPNVHGFYAARLPADIV
jgi:hypothetical protein